ncbi:MAG: DJ-1/PfpI family protein [Candidatus Hodarchaeales archaeon]|jgi:transcriptional regulator GlxA family with amidase domain
MVNIGLLIFDQAVVLDFCGPFEVFRRANQFKPKDLEINVLTVAISKNPVNAQGLSINPAYSFEDCPKLDILLVPGGTIKNEKILYWIAKQAPQVDYLLSVCTGALHLGKLGLLDGLKATTHYKFLDTLKETAPQTVVTSARYIEDGKIITSAGITAGIDMSLFVVEKLWGEELATKVASFIEYPNYK